MKSWITYLGLAVLTAACGKSDPLTDYSLKTVPAHNKPNPIQTAGLVPYSVKYVGTTGRSVANFIEGKPGWISIEVRPVDKNITDYTLEINEKPADAVLKRVNPVMWRLDWTPKNVLRGSQVEAFAYLNLTARVTAATDQRYFAVGTMQLDTIELVVRKTLSAPVVEHEEMPKDYVTPDEALQFSIDVFDPGASGLIPPAVAERTTCNMTGKGNYKINGAPYVTLADVPPQKLENGNWRFQFVFDPRGQTIPSINRFGVEDSSVSEIQTCFRTRFVSPTKQISAEHQSLVRIVFAPGQSALKWDPKNTTLKVGQAKTFEFTVEGANQRGNLNIEHVTRSLETVPGMPKLNCTPRKTAKQIVADCKLNWKIACDSAYSGSYRIELKAHHKVGEKTVTSDLGQDITVVKDEAICQPPKPLAVKPVAPAKKPAPPKPAPSAGGTK